MAGDRASETERGPSLDPLGSVGDRVRLLGVSDFYTRLEPGAEGVIRRIDPTGTRHIDWDSGSNLGLVEDADRWEVIERAQGKSVDL